MMNFYENIVILNPSLNEEELKAAADKISDLIRNSGGEVFKADNWGRRKLAYELNKQKMGVYYYFLFKAPSALCLLSLAVACNFIESRGL